MTVVPLHPDQIAPPSPPNRDTGDFARALDGVGGLLERAQRSEDAFARGGGSLIDAMYQRSRADVMLAVTTAALQHAAQSLQSVVNMQI